MWIPSLGLYSTVIFICSCYSKPLPHGNQRPRLLQVMQEMSIEAKDAPLETRVQRLIQEQPLVSIQLVSTLYAYVSILLISIIKLPSQTNAFVRLQSGIAVACSLWIELISKIQNNELPTEMSNDPIALQKLLSAVIASRSGQMFILSCLSLILAGDTYSVFPLLLRCLPELLQVMLSCFQLITPPIEIPKQIIDVIFPSQNVPIPNEIINSTTNFTIQNPGILNACCDIISLPLEISLLPKALRNLRSKNFVVVLLNMCFLYVFLHYLSKRVAEIRSTIESIPKNFGNTVLSALKMSELIKRVTSTKVSPKKKVISKKKRKSNS